MTSHHKNENQRNSNSNWWRETTIYQIYPRSFCDSNGDGIGDVPGILSKLDYLQDLGVETLWLSPIFRSPQQDHGYDISNYYEINPEYGTMEQVQELIAAVHRRGMKIAFDMVMNHTSDQHEWFQDSVHRRNGKQDWYIWHDTIPNNWRSMLGTCAWIYHPVREQYYLASFLNFQPDLNYRHPDVKEEMLNVVKFWMEQDVDGFRLDIFNVIYKDASLRDNPFSWRPFPSHEETDGYFQRKIYTVNHPDTIAFSKELRSFVDSFGDKERFLLGEIMGQNAQLKAFLGTPQQPGLNLCFMFQMVNFRFNEDYFCRLLQEFEQEYPYPQYTPVIVFSNHDIRRLFFRLKGDVAKAKVMITLQTTVRGVPCLYYGEEIGMTESNIPFANSQDPLATQVFGKIVPQWLYDSSLLDSVSMNRDNCRTPMQWTSHVQHGGFTTNDTKSQHNNNLDYSSPARGENNLTDPLLSSHEEEEEELLGNKVHTWLPVNPDTTKGINVETQINQEDSLFQTYRTLLHLRKSEPALHRGTLKVHSSNKSDGSYCSRTSSLLSFERCDNKEDRLLIIVNFKSNDCMLVDSSTVFEDTAHNNLTVVFSTDPRNAIVEEDDEERQQTIKIHGPSAMILRDNCPTIEKKDS